MTKLERITESPSRSVFALALEKELCRRRFAFAVAKNDELTLQRRDALRAQTAMVSALSVEALASTTQVSTVGFVTAVLHFRLGKFGFTSI